MPRHDADRRAALAEIAQAQDGLVTAAQLRELGIGRSSVTHRLHESAIWRRLLPGIYLTHGGAPTLSQRRRAAMLYAGQGGVLTGTHALAVHGSRVAARSRDDSVLVTVPHHRHRSSTDFVVIERTIRPARAVNRLDLEVAQPARAAIDAARRMSRLDDVRALLADVIQSGLASVEQLDEELQAAQRRGTRLARKTLGALRAGTRSAPEAQLRELWLESGLTEPLWNADLLTPDGEFVARPDAYVPEVGVAIEVESKEFHYSDRDWAHTMRRRNAMTAAGIVVLQVPPSRLTADGPAFMDEVAATIRTHAGRRAPAVRVRNRAA